MAMGRRKVEVSARDTVQRLAAETSLSTSRIAHEAGVHTATAARWIAEDGRAALRRLRGERLAKAREDRELEKIEQALHVLKSSRYSDKGSKIADVPN